MSLQDIIMQRAALQHQNMLNSDNAYNVLPALANGVAQGIMEEQRIMRAKKEQEAERQRAMEEDRANRNRMEQVKQNAIKSGQKVKSVYDSTGKETVTVAPTDPNEERKLQIEKNKLTLQEKSIKQKEVMNQIIQKQMGMVSEDALSEFNFSDNPRIDNQNVNIGNNQSKFQLEGFTVNGLSFKNPNFAAEAEKIKNDAKRADSIKGAQIQTLANIESISNVANELSNTYAQGVREGGMGSLLAQGISKGALLLGGDVAENFPNTSAYNGSVVEILGRMMPLLTQQGDKEGSVRLVESIFRKLEKTLPRENTPPKNARMMLEKTLTNMYRYARASQQLGVTNETVDLMSDSERNNLSETVKRVADTIKIEGQEREIFDKFLAGALEPLDNLIKERDKKKSVTNEDRVSITKDGKNYSVPASQLEEALKQGYKRK